MYKIIATDGGKFNIYKEYTLICTAYTQEMADTIVKSLQPKIRKPKVIRR